MRIWTLGYTSQISCSPVKTWIADTETPWPYQIVQGSPEGLRSPLRLEGLCVSSQAHCIDFPGRWCSSQRKLVLHLGIVGITFSPFALLKCLHMQIAQSRAHYGVHCESTLYMIPLKNLLRCCWAIQLRLYPSRVKATVFDWCPKGAQRGHYLMHFAFYTTGRPSKCTPFLFELWIIIIIGL